MKFKFKKEDEIRVTLINKEGIESDFNYSDMIKLLYFEDCVDEPIVEGTFTEEEIKSISDLVSSIKNIKQEQNIEG